MDGETPKLRNDSGSSPTASYEVPSTTPSFLDVQLGLYAIAAVASGILALIGKESRFWLWLLPVSVIALPGAIKQSFRGQGGSTDVPRSFRRLRMWILGCFGGLILGKGLSAHHWPTLLVGTAYVVWAFWSGPSKEEQREIALGAKG